VDVLRLIARAGVVWEYVPARSSIFPALPVRIDMAYQNAHVCVDRGKLLLNDETKEPNYIDCGKTADYPTGKHIIWSPLEDPAFDNYDAADGCILRFEITAVDEKVYRGTIIVDQIEMAEHGRRLYGMSLAETDTSLIFVKDEEYGGGCILKLP